MLLPRGSAGGTRGVLFPIPDPRVKTLERAVSACTSYGSFNGPGIVSEAGHSAASLRHASFQRASFMHCRSHRCQSGSTLGQAIGISRHEFCPG